MPPGQGGCSVHPGLILQLVSSSTVNLPLFCFQASQTNEVILSVWEPTVEYLFSKIENWGNSSHAID